MIQSNIKNKLPHHFKNYRCFDDDVFIVDYTNQTQTSQIKRSVECFCKIPPSEINYFSVRNKKKIKVDVIIFDNSSFILKKGLYRSQCEAVVFPSLSNTESWILFCELKYNDTPKRNREHLNKAFKQLYRTRYYYIQNEIFSNSNISYLIASLPKQREPFPHFLLPPQILSKLKKKRNIILDMKNTVEIVNSNSINTRN